MVEPFESHHRTRARILTRSDEEARAGAAELQRTLLVKLGFACIPTAAIDRVAEGVHVRWKLRIAAAMGSLVHWFVYMQVFAPLSSA